MLDSVKGVIIGDLGGDSVDFVGIKNNKPVASVEGEHLLELINFLIILFKK